MAARARIRVVAPFVPRVAARVRSGVREVEDSSETFVPAPGWLTDDDRRQDATAERLAEGLLDQNQGLLRDMGIAGDVRRRRGVPGLWLKTSTRVGAVPLLSPISARADFGLVVRPRFAWQSAGDMMAATGFRCAPQILPQLPELPQSERRVPAWVLSAIILPRLGRLLASLDRRFDIVDLDLRAPAGSVDWQRYATTRLPMARVLDVPCRRPDLREDADLLAALHHVVLRHRAALLAQRSTGPVVHALLAVCARMLHRLAGHPPRLPSPALRRRWIQRPLQRSVFREGIQAVGWTVDERGLAGLSDLEGLAWCLDMERFFEAWTEAVAERLAQRIGGVVRAGRTGQTRSALDWRPPQLATQGALVPDVVVLGPTVAVVFDAKYKRHAERLQHGGWSGLPESLRETHRDDLLQVLAYSALVNAPRVVACLAYPVAAEAWADLVERQRAWAKARVSGGPRNVELAWCALPMGGDPGQAAEMLAQVVREVA
ncbi:MAG: hypothetical protein EXR79_05435 [Myxococcales bacterium]|nr:hypothetical protein [Myxococcales bacterium]